MNPEETSSLATLLFVDDEPNIVAALRRLFRTGSYRILTASNGAEGLSVMAQEGVDLVISDMRMPGMSGAEFLAEVAERWPATIRMLLTGYADLDSTIDAINRGHIYRYVSKPWEDTDLRLSVQNALAQQALRRERERLLEQIERQNQELRDLNATLEARVRARTEEIQQTADMLDLAYQELKRSYVETIPIVAHLLEMREGEGVGHGRRVGESARGVAQDLGASEQEAEQIYFAGLLHNIGKLGLADELVFQPYAELGPKQRREFMRHPVIGQAALMGLDALQPTALLIRHQHERFDGNGFPDRLEGHDIPLGARILAVANDYDALQLGRLVKGELSSEEAQVFLTTNAGARYDPVVVEAFIRWLEANPTFGQNGNDVRLTSADICPGMVLARDLVTADGLLLLAHDRVIDERVIARIQSFEIENDSGFTIYVKREEDHGAPDHDRR